MLDAVSFPYVNAKCMLPSDHFLILIWMNCVAPRINEIIKTSPETQVRSGNLCTRFRPDPQLLQGITDIRLCFSFWPYLTFGSFLSA